MAVPEGNIDPAKQELINTFRNKIKGKSPDVTEKNAQHDGKKGHWLEEQFGVTANADNKPDINGYELKNETRSKTTFGDWSPNETIYTDVNTRDLFEGKTKFEKRESFLKIFGKPNLEKEGRCSWSGEACPKIDKYNTFGQKLEITPNNDIVAVYSFPHDQRPDKDSIIPKELQKDNVQIAKWYGEQKPENASPRSKTLKSKLEDKFNDKGFFTCKTDESGKYEKICFGRPIPFKEWIKDVKDGKVIFDSGMHEKNKRPYAEWRANNGYWDDKLKEEYE